LIDKINPRFLLTFTVLQIDGFVLVGGKSSRMGTNKFALRFGGATFAERAAAALRKIAPERVSFVGGANQKSERLPLDIPCIADIFSDKAALGGICTALAHSDSEWAVILACDYPFVTENLFVRLAEITSRVDAEISAVAPVQADGRLQPLCAFYRVKDCLAAGELLLESDEVLPARRIIENVAARLVYFEELADLDGAENFFINVNTPEEFLRAQNIFRRQNL